MTWRSWVNSQVLWTVHVIYQEGVETMDILLDRSYTLKQRVSDLSKPSAAFGKFLSDTQYVFTLEPYPNGTPAQTVVPAMDYWKQTIEVKKGDHLKRMKTVRIFNPMHVLGNKISESDIDGLNKFKFHDHPDIRAQIEVMKPSSFSP